MTAGPYNTRVTAPQRPGERQAGRDAAATVVAGVLVSALSALLTAVVYGAATALVLVAAVLGSAPAVLSAVAVLRRRPLASTPADRVTLTRVVLASGCAAVTVLVVAGAVPERSWWLLSLTVPTLLLDAVDGKVARRTGSVTAAGARLDGEVDAGVLVVLSVAVAPALGVWVLLIGALRYLFFAASWVRPMLREPLAFSAFRRVVAGLQGAVLSVAIAPVVPLALATALVLSGLVLLSVSFGRDVLTLEAQARSHRRSPVQRPAHAAHSPQAAHAARASHPVPTRRARAVGGRP